MRHWKERLKIEMTITRDDEIDQIRDGTTTILSKLIKTKPKKKMESEYELIL